MPKISRDWEAIFQEMTEEERRHALAAMFWLTSKPRDRLSAFIFQGFWQYPEVVPGFDGLAANQQKDVIDLGIHTMRTACKLAKPAGKQPASHAQKNQRATPETIKRLDVAYEKITDTKNVVRAGIFMAILGNKKNVPGFELLTTHQQKDVIELGIQAMQTAVKILGSEG